MPGPWYERLPHFRMGFTPEQRQGAAGRVLRPAPERGRRHPARSSGCATGSRPHLLISEIRTIAADDLWMSPCYKQPSVAIHFTWKQDWDAVRELLPVIEKELAPYKARPHWGKLFTMPRRRVASRAIAGCPTSSACSARTIPRQVPQSVSRFDDLRLTDLLLSLQRALLRYTDPYLIL